MIGVARHSENMEELVIYEALYDSKEFGPNAIWARPKEMFLETVDVAGEEKPRFEYLGT